MALPFGRPPRWTVMQRSAVGLRPARRQTLSHSRWPDGSGQTSALLWRESLSGWLEFWAELEFGR